MPESRRTRCRRCQGMSAPRWLLARMMSPGQPVRFIYQPRQAGWPSCDPPIRPAHRLAVRHAPTGPVDPVASLNRACPASSASHLNSAGTLKSVTPGWSTLTRHVSLQTPSIPLKRRGSRLGGVPPTAPSAGSAARDGGGEGSTRPGRAPKPDLEPPGLSQTPVSAHLAAAGRHLPHVGAGQYRCPSAGGAPGPAASVIGYAACC